MAPRARSRPSRALEGEDLKTSHCEDARHWMSIYADFLEFKRGILDCVRSDLASLQRMVRHQGKEVALTNREFQPWLDFVIARSSCSSSWTIPTATPPLPRSWARPGPTRPVSREVTQLRSAGPEDTRGSRDPGGPRQQARPRLLAGVPTHLRFRSRVDLVRGEKFLLLLLPMGHRALIRRIVVQSQDRPFRLNRVPRPL